MSNGGPLTRVVVRVVGRKQPENLPRDVIEAEAARVVTDSAAHGPRKLIGYDETEKRMFEPARLWVSLLARAAGRRGSRERFAAQIITANYDRHLPIHRQQDCFAGSDWAPSRSTLLDVQSAAAKRIAKSIVRLPQTAPLIESSPA